MAERTEPLAAGLSGDHRCFRILGDWFETIRLVLQIPFCKMPELVVPALGFSRLLPKFVSADTNLFVGRVRHLTESWKKRNSSAEPSSHPIQTIRQFDGAYSKTSEELFRFLLFGATSDKISSLRTDDLLVDRLF